MTASSGCVTLALHYSKHIAYLKHCGHVAYSLLVPKSHRTYESLILDRAASEVVSHYRRD